LLFFSIARVIFKTFIVIFNSKFFISLFIIHFVLKNVRMYTGACAIPKFLFIHPSTSNLPYFFY
jgi:hypothetical protein